MYHLLLTTLVIHLTICVADLQCRNNIVSGWHMLNLLNLVSKAGGIFDKSMNCLKYNSILLVVTSLRAV